MALMNDINLTGLEILVVDDDNTARMVNEKILTRFGAAVTTAHDGATALELFRQFRYPVVITDICMSGMDGMELVAGLKRIDGTVQVIGVTAACDTELLISAIQLGFNDYIVKPVALEGLIQAVKRCGDAVTARRSLEKEQNKFRSVVESLSECLTIKDPDMRILYQNRAMIGMFGDLTGKRCFTLWGRTTPCDDCPTLQTKVDGLSHVATRQFVSDGRQVMIESTTSALKDADGTITGMVEIIRDISERAKNEQIICDMAFHDHLTGLANRRLFEDRIALATAAARRYGTRFGLFYLDLDHFKEINDTRGHEVGDTVLVATGERIRGCCRRDLDTISRQGGDEFCILVEESGNGNSLQELAVHLLARIAEPIRVNGAEVVISASLGIAVYPHDGETPMELEMAADRAMYAAKQAGRNTFRFASVENGF